MVRLTFCGIILAVTFCCAGFYSSAISQTTPQSKTIKKATGSVSGRITVKGKGKAGIIVGFRIGDFGPPIGPLFKAVTDQEGNYRITDLPAGNYQVTPVAPAYVLSDVNSFGQRGKSLILSDGESVEGIDFSMVRGAVITGKVTQADGRPVIEEPINITPAEIPDRPGQGWTTQSGSTDDRGIYRVFGLQAGKYKVSVGQTPDGTFGGNRPGRVIFERVFYPDVTNPNDAKVVDLSAGSEATNIDITVGQSISGFSVAGLVTDGETNQPLGNLRLGLQRITGERDANFIGTNVLSNSSGQFRFESLMPGRYSVFIMPQPNVEARFDPVPFEVVDQDVTGILIKTSKGGSVSGTIVLEGSGDKTLQSKLSQLRIQVYVATGTPNSAWAQNTPINADGGFRVGGLQAGIAMFQLVAQDRGLLKGFVISRLERDGVVVPRGIEIKTGEQVSGVRLVVVYGSGIIRGTIKVENGPLPTGARLSIRLAKPDDQTFNARPTEVDARGRFTVEGVPAGSYDLYVSSYIPGSRTRPPFSKQSIIVNEGSVTEVEAVLDLSASEPPTP